jgi:gamma-glutamyltranspeptidase/glutathione hydrolase
LVRRQADHIVDVAGDRAARRQTGVRTGIAGRPADFSFRHAALSNLIDHGMTVQEAVEAPRIWTQGHALELEAAFPASVFEAMRDRGHPVASVGNVAGGMSAIRFADDGMMEGAACWRADGTPVGVGGGLARAGVRFRPEAGRT